MKKLIAMMILVALGTSVMAAGYGGGSSAVTGTSSAKEQIPLTNGKDKDYVNFQTETTQGTSGLTYSVTGSKENNRLGHVYFTTMTQAKLDAYNEANNTTMSRITVQFVGTYEESYTKDYSGWGYPTPYEMEYSLEITDYGIYMYDPKTGKMGAFQSALENNSFDIEPGKSFGVYYKGTQVDTKTTGEYGWNGSVKYNGTPTVTSSKEVTVTSTGGYIGNYDTGNGEGEHAGQNKVTIYELNEDGVVESTEGWTYKKYMCMFGANDPIDNRHWEFMLQTTLDDPKVIVRPEDVPGVAGQPLPGTLATILISGLCMGALRKRNKKA